MTHRQLNTEQWGPHRGPAPASSLRDPAQGSLSWKWLPPQFVLVAGSSDFCSGCSFGKSGFPGLTCRQGEDLNVESRDHYPSPVTKRNPQSLASVVGRDGSLQHC